MFGFFFWSFITPHSISVTRHSSLKIPQFPIPTCLAHFTQLFITQFFYFFVGPTLEHNVKPRFPCNINSFQPFSPHILPEPSINLVKLSAQSSSSSSAAASSLCRALWCGLLSATPRGCDVEVCVYWTGVQRRKDSSICERSLIPNIARWEASILLAYQSCFFFIFIFYGFFFFNLVSICSDGELETTDTVGKRWDLWVFGFFFYGFFYSFFFFLDLYP